MKVTFTLTTADLRQRFSPPTPWRQRLRLLLSYASPLLLCALACAAGDWKGFSFAVLKCLTVLYGVVGSLFAAAWALEIIAARLDKPVVCFVEISDTGLSRQEASGSVCRYPWSHLENIESREGWLVFLSGQGQYLVVIPMSAIDSDDQAQSFLTQSRERWEATKQEQRERAQKASVSWPPPPRIG